ncbi:hypothetical protein SAMD00023353_7400040 [Rosellinia necatrix]|uniref:Uncharacterized protein n=1 Tax=Rosellinia necatrix TaxID=77044 RepID=A0A1S8AB34_ROSNE|nr:hypothetical protein SAMD00023353_7400040 [Rosellinia necatrix]
MGIPRGFELWLCKGKRRGHKPLHWMLMLKGQETEKGTWYRMTAENGVYELQILEDKGIRSQGISNSHFIGELEEKYRNRVKAACMRTKPRQSQEWTVAVLRDLEEKLLISQGIFFEGNFFKRNFVASSFVIASSFIVEGICSKGICSEGNFFKGNFVASSFVIASSFIVEGICSEGICSEGICIEGIFIQERRTQGLS